MASYQSNSRPISRSGASRWSVALRIFMLIAAWQGPMPWCHRHGTLNDSDLTQAPAWLAQHLQTHHASVAPCSCVFFGWHMHAVFPGQSTDDPDQPQKAEQFRLPATVVADCLAAHLTGGADGLSVSLARQIELPTGGLAGFDTRSAAHFFDRFAPTLPLPLRFCVARC